MIPTPPSPASSAAEVNAEVSFSVPKLTRRMKQSDEEAYRDFYDAYYNRLWRYLLVVTAGDEEATAEALQATLVRVVRHIKVFQDEASFWGWLTVLARSALSDQRRGRRRYLAFLDRFTRHTEAHAPPAAGNAPDTRLLGLLESNLATMPAEERALLEAKYFESRPVREIAEQLGTSEKAVESRLTRLRQKLKMAVLEELKSEHRSQ